MYGFSWKVHNVMLTSMASQSYAGDTSSDLKGGCEALKDEDEGTEIELCLIQSQVI
jgi:hypothetical protein